MFDRSCLPRTRHVAGQEIHRDQAVVFRSAMLTPDLKLDTASLNRNRFITHQTRSQKFLAPAFRMLHTAHLALYELYKFEAGGCASSSQLRATKLARASRSRAEANTCYSLRGASNALSNHSRGLLQGAPRHPQATDIRILLFTMVVARLVGVGTTWVLSRFDLSVSVEPRLLVESI
jgi:hypothetical protein